MSQQEALAKLVGNLPSTVKFSPEEIAAVSTNADYLPRLSVMGSNSEMVKSGKCALGVFGLVNGENVKNLGTDIDVVVISVRPKALRIEGGSPLSYFNKDSETFKAVQRESDVQDSGCMCGPEFLIWVPSEKTFATFFCSGKSARRESPNVLAIIKPEGAASYQPGAASLKVHFIPRADGRKYSWHTFLCKPCSTPITILPEGDHFAEELEKFNNPIDSKVEVVNKNDNSTERAR